MSFTTFQLKSRFCKTREDDKDAEMPARNSAAVEAGKDTGKKRGDDEEGGCVSVENRSSYGELWGKIKDASHTLSNDAVCSAATCKTSDMRSGCTDWSGNEKRAQNLKVDWEVTNSKAGRDMLGTVNATRTV
jgi:hypothetical protein